MVTRYPTFFDKFKCLGGDCKKSCCIGWELDVDSDTYDYYMSIPGEFGDRLRRELSKASDEEYSFCLPIDGRCPFLNGDNLCDIVLTLGEESLCDICQTYPRYTFSYKDTIDKSLTISCEEACRLLFDEKDGIRFTEAVWNEDDSEDYDEELELEIVEEFKKRQKALFDLLYNRSLSLEERMLSLCKENVLDYPEIRSNEERLRILSYLEPVDDEWIELLEKLGSIQGSFEKKDTFGSVSVDDRDYVLYENLLIYFLFRYLPRSLFGGDFDIQVRFCLFCVLCIMDMECVMHSVSDAASLFSREVEHSDDNIEMIMEEMLF